MLGMRRILLVLCCSVAVNVTDALPPPTDIQITALGLGKVNVSWKHNIIPPDIKTVVCVKVNTPEIKDIKGFSSDNFYVFDWLAVHHGLNAQVAVIELIDDNLSTENIEWGSKDLPPFPGDEGTAPSNLTCNVHIDEKEKRWLSCFWLPGEKAPLDTQYNLYFRYSHITKKCLNYTTEPGGGRRTGCRTLFRDTYLIDTNFLVHINGSSASHSRQICAIEHVFELEDVEVIPPVWNLTLTKDTHLSWIIPIKSYAADCFHYQIQIWSKDKNETITVNKVQKYWHEDLKRQTNTQHVRVRAVGKIPCWSSEKYSPWSEVLHIEGNNQDMLWITLIACFFVVGLALFLLLIRFWRSIFPQIPKPKDDLKDTFKNAQHQTLMHCNSWDTEEVISYIEVMECLDKQCKMSLD